MTTFETAKFKELLAEYTQYVFESGFAEADMDLKGSELYHRAANEKRKEIYALLGINSYEEEDNGQERES